MANVVHVQSSAHLLGMRRGKPGRMCKWKKRRQRCKAARAYVESEKVGNGEGEFRMVDALESLNEEKRSLFLGALGLLGSSALAVMGPMFSGLLIQAVTTGKGQFTARQATMILACAYSGEVLFTKLYVSNAWRVAEAFAAGVRKRLFRVLLTREMSFFETHSRADISGLLNREMAIARSALTGNFSRDRGLRAILEGLLASSIIAVLGRELALPLLACIFTFASMAAYHQRRIVPTLEADARAQGDTSQVAEDALYGIRTIRSCGGEGQAARAHADACERARGAGIAVGRANSSKECFNRTCIYLCLLGLYTLGGKLVSSGRLAPGVLFACIGCAI